MFSLKKNSQGSMTKRLIIERMYFGEIASIMYVFLNGTLYSNVWDIIQFGIPIKCPFHLFGFFSFLKQSMINSNVIKGTNNQMAVHKKNVFLRNCYHY